MKDKIDYFFAPYKKEKLEDKPHMEFSNKRQPKNSQVWASISDMILSSNKNGFDKTINQIKRFKGSRRNTNVGQFVTFDLSKPFKNIVKNIQPVSKIKASHAKPLHQDSLGRKIFNLKFKHFETLQKHK